MLAAQNAGLEGAAGLTAEALGAGTAATEAAVAGAAEAGLAGGAGAAGAGMAAAMPWVGAGLLAGKAFGLFSEGGPVDYKECGGKMKTRYKAEGGRSDQDDYQDIARLYDLYMSKDAPTPKYEARPYNLKEPKVYSNDLPSIGEKYKMTPLNYRAEGGDVGFFDYLKKSFTEKPSWEDDVAVQVPVLDGSGNPTNMTSTVYRPNPNLEKTIARDIYGEYDDGEDMGDASYMAAAKPHSYVTQEAVAPRGVLRMTPLMPTYEEAGNVQRESYADPYYFDTQQDFSAIKPYRREEPKRKERKEIPSYQLPYYDPANRFKKDSYATPFSTGGSVGMGPLKSTQYKSAGGEVYTESYYNSSQK
jgi:hypothetical protein